jgi:hypothetical protein
MISLLSGELTKIRHLKNTESVQDTVITLGKWFSNLTAHLRQVESLLIYLGKSPEKASAST